MVMVSLSASVSAVPPVIKFPETLVASVVSTPSETEAVSALTTGRRSMLRRIVAEPQRRPPLPWSCLPVVVPTVPPAVIFEF